MILVALAALFGILLIAPELNKISPDKAKLELYLGIIMFSASALGVGINLNAFSPWVAVTSFLAIPFIYFCMGLLVYLVGLTGKPVNANIIAQVFYRFT